MIEVPRQEPCPVCNLVLEVNAKGPHGLCWHDCEYVVSLQKGKLEDAQTPAQRIISSIVSQVEVRASSMPPKDLASILNSAVELEKESGAGKAGGELSAALSAFLSAEVEPNPLE